MQTRVKRKNENSCGRIASLWVNFFLFFNLFIVVIAFYLVKKKNHGVHMQLLNSHSKDESRIWETKMLIWDMEQHLALVSILSLPGSLLSHLSTHEVGWRANRCSEKQEEVPKSVQSYKWKTGWDFTSILLQGPSPSCQLLPLVSRSLPSPGNSFLLNKMKRFNFLPALCGSIHVWFINHLYPTHL